MLEFIVKATAKITLSLAFFSSPCWAYYDVLDNGEILPKGTYKLTGDTQLLTQTSGVNVGAIIDAGFQDQFGVRALVGAGKTDYFLGGMFKWIPIPDVEGQPAVGFNVGLLYARWNDTSELTIRGEPLVSKKFTMGEGAVTPYAALPIGILMRNSTSHDVSATQLSLQLAVGAQLQVERWKTLQFLAEVGVDLSHSYSEPTAGSYVTAAAIWYFDDQNGFQLK